MDHRHHDGASLILFACPMHPEVVKNAPAKCPGCGMDLIPVSTHATAGKPQKADIHAGHDMPGMPARQSLGDGGSHRDHERAMTDPSMAKAMEADMRRRFFVSFLLSVPIFLYSPAGIDIFELHLWSPIPLNGLLFILTTPVVFIALESMREEIEKLLASGKTLSIVAIDNTAVGLIGIFDSVRGTSKKTIRELKKFGIETAMITGDNKKIAEAVGAELGIDRVFAEVLPEEKAGYVKKLQDEGKFVAMAGDGVNDAPALAQANIGIAIGAGTDVAMETANIVLMRSDPYDIVAAIRLSRATVRKMKQNLFWAAIYNVLAIPVAAGVFYHSLGWSLRPEIAALLMSASSIIVASNAVLLKRVEPSLRL